MPNDPAPPAEQQRIDDFSREVAEAFEEIIAADNQPKEVNLEARPIPVDQG